MRRILGVMLLLASALASAHGGSARSAIEAQYKRWARAALNNDVEGVLAILAPGYALRAFDGTVIERKAYEASLRKRKAEGQKPAAYTTSIETLTVSGNGATVLSLETSVKATADPITNKVQKLVHIHRYRDVWIRASGRWRLASTVTLLEKTTIAK